MTTVYDEPVEKINPGAEDAAQANPFADFPTDLSPGETMVLLAARGLAVFPCEPDSKAPAIRRGFRSASTKVRLSADHAWVHYTTADGERAYSLPVDCNIALEPGSAGFFVVDIDPKNGGDQTWAELEARHGTITTREVRTPSGGRHLWFRGTVPQVNKKLGPGIDTRCFGGYVLLPPSGVKGRTYTWIDDSVPIAPLPAWIVEEIEAAAAQEAEILDELRDQIYNGEGGDAFERRLALIGDHEGGLGFYDPMLRAVGAGVALGMAAGAILDRLGETVEAADRHNHSVAEIGDRLSKMPAAIRSFQAKDAQRQREAEEIAEEVADDEVEDTDFEDAVAAQEAGGAEFTEPFDEEGEEEEEAAEAQDPFTGTASVNDTSEPNSGASATDDAFATEEPEPTTAPPRDPRKAAVEKVRQILKEWLRRGKQHARNLVALQLPAGFGKTHNMLMEQQRVEPIPLEDLERLLDEDLSDLPEHEIGKLACAVGRHTLAEEIQETDAALRPISDPNRIPILTGRNAENCKRWDVVEAGFKKGFSQSSFCRQTLPDGSEVLCPFFEHCRSNPGQYQHTQEEIQKAPNAIVMHSHLAIPWLSALALKTRTRIWMDENPTQVFRARQEFDTTRLELVNEQDFASLDRWCAEDPTSQALQRRTRKAFKNLTNLSAVLLSTLATPSQGLKIEHLAAWSPGEIREMARMRETIETWRRGKIDPSLNDAALKEQLAERKPVPHLAGLLYRLADEVEARKTGPVYSLERDPRTGKIVARGRISTDDLPPNLLITDATLSPEILKAVFPGHPLEHVKIEVPRNALIAQVKDLTFSRNWLLKDGHLPEVTAWLEQLAQHYKNLVVITTKRIRCEITGEDPKTKLPVYCEAYHKEPGIKIAHYGNIRGSNQFADCDALIILGREQPPPEDIEEIAKAFWYDTEKPLRLAKTGAGGGKVYVPSKRCYEMADGTKVKGNVEVHRDPRCQAVLSEVRENEMVQAIDRGRLIWNQDRKHIYILCDIPLPGVKIDRLVSWDNLRGAGRLHEALSAQVAAGETCLPLEPGWLSTHYPKMWKTLKAAQRWVESSSEVLEIMRNPHRSNIDILLEGRGFLEITIIESLPDQRQPGHNRWSRALVWGDIAPGASLARALGLKETEFRWRPA
jgi:hypothetical protein